MINYILIILITVSIDSGGGIKRSHLRNNWLLSAAESTGNELVYHSRSYYTAGIPSNESITFKRFKRLEASHPKNRCFGKECKPDAVDKMKWQWRKYNDEWYLEINSGSGLPVYLKVINLSENTLTVKEYSLASLAKHLNQKSTDEEYPETDSH